MKVIIEHSTGGAWYVWGPRKWHGLRDCIGAGLTREEALDSARRNLKAPPPPKRVTTREEVEL